MSRFRRIIHGAASGYAALIAASIFSLALVPLALHYLRSKERFGLWTLMSSISGYLSLIDLGMSGSIARLLIDHKDDPERGAYGSLIKTGWLVLTAQAMLIFCAGFGFAPWVSTLLDIPASLQREFIGLMRWQTFILGLTFASRIFSHILQAHQRIDLINYSQILTVVLNFFLMWFFFVQGHGVFSLVWASLLSSVAAMIALVIAAIRLRLFPAKGNWGQASWAHFCGVFGYGKDLFLVTVGNQLILGTQTMIITNRLGLGASALWYAGTRLMNLLNLAIWRVCDVSGPVFSEMMARGETTLLLRRFRAIVILTASVSGFAAVSYALCNSSFVWVWTSFSRQLPLGWASHNDVLLGVWMIVLALLHCHNSLAALTKHIGFMRYVYFIEGLAFVSSAWFAARGAGFSGIILCSVVCSALFSGCYGVYRISRYFGLTLREVTVEWQVPMFKVLAIYTPLALVAWWVSRNFDPFVHLAIGGVVTALPGSYILLRFGLPKDFQRELLQRAPRQVNPLLRWVFVGVTA
jgi:polysaccharide biosynthesis protein